VGALVYCQAAYYATVGVDLTLTALVGLALAPSPAWATVPLATITATGAVASVATGLVAARLGYGRAMALGALVGAAGGLVSVTAVLVQSFLLLCVGTGLVGVYRATGGYIRFVGADLAGPARRDRAISTILLGGLAAAFVGPWLATASQDALPTRYAAPFLVVTLLCLSTLPALAPVLRAERSRAGDRAGAPAHGAGAVALRDVEDRSTLVLGALVLVSAAVLMTMIMAIGPLANQHAGHTTAAGALMIQLHLVGMFAPALFSGPLVERLGARRVAVTGGLLFVAGAVVGSTGDGVARFVAALAFNGVAWNLLFVAGTSLLASCYPPGRGGRVQALAEGAGNGASVLASLSASAVLVTVGWHGANLFAAAAATVVTLLVVPATLRGRRTTPGEAGR